MEFGWVLSIFPPFFVEVAAAPDALHGPKWILRHFAVRTSTRSSQKLQILLPPYGKVAILISRRREYAATGPRTSRTRSIQRVAASAAKYLFTGKMTGARRNAKYPLNPCNFLDWIDQANSNALPC